MSRCAFKDKDGRRCFLQYEHSGEHWTGDASKDWDFTDDPYEEQGSPPDKPQEGGGAR